MKRLLVLLPLAASLAGCGVMAAPCRFASAGLKMIPAIGGVAAAPADGCAAEID
ncbi:DUF6726 family protein [Cupriavidus sp. CuC1]|uniref:DUF6726 family protein n=1 Tax=Cupriavidus sp. CuC1 TaxID=3373131 RepID=UPI0037D42DC4